MIRNCLPQYLLTFLVSLVTLSFNASAATYTTAIVGAWNNVATWGGAGTPTITDDVVINHTVTISASRQCNDLTINMGGVLTANADVAVFGNFTINSGGWYTHNNLGNAATTIFRGTESFHPNSTIEILSWYDITGTPFATDISGSLGNLIFNTGSALTWDQGNLFESTNTVLGNITVSHAIVSLDRFGNISNTTLNNVTLNHANAEFYGHFGAHPGSFTLNITNNLAITAFNQAAFVRGGGNCIVNISGNMTVAGSGNFYYSLGNGTIDLNITGNTAISGGNNYLKFMNGAATMDVDGNFTQTGGQFHFHGGPFTDTDTKTVTINGDFTHSAGSIDFDATDGTAANTLVINGDDYLVSGTGMMTRSGGAAAPATWPILQFSRAGTATNYNFTGTYSFAGAKQVINAGTEVLLATNMELASGTAAGVDYLTVNGTLTAGTFMLYNNLTYANSGLSIGATGTLRTANVNGLYNSTDAATIQFNGGSLNFFLHASSTIEYNGVDNQVLTGYPFVAGGTNDHKYGILDINFGGTANTEYVYLTADNFARTRLVMTAGELNLDEDHNRDATPGHTFTIESGLATALTSTAGYIRSETSDQSAILAWIIGTTTGSHAVPFGYDNTTDLRYTFNLTAGNAGTVSFSSYRTDLGAIDNNIPWPTGVTNLGADGDMWADRFWEVNVSGAPTADLTFMYADAEIANSGEAALDIQSYTTGTSTWASVLTGSQSQSLGTNEVTVSGVTFFEQIWALEGSSILPIELVSFDAAYNDNSDVVDLAWTTATEKNNEFFSIERSANGTDFEVVGRVDGAGNSHYEIDYNTIDPNPVNGTTYYRLKQTDYDGGFEYSDIVAIDIEGPNIAFSIYPNPSAGDFNINLSEVPAEDVEIAVYDLMGQRIYSNILTNVSAGNVNSGINLNDVVSTGIYLVKATSENTSFEQKLIVQ